MSRWLVAIAVLAAASPSNVVAQAGPATRTTLVIRYPGAYTLAFDGHTDAVGSDQANLQLSQSRAEVVRDYLVSAGVKADRVAAARGRGKSEPVASNDTDEGRRRNRRVQIIVNDQAKAGS